MVNDSYFRFDDDNNIKYTFSQSWQANWVSWRHTPPYIEWKIIARIVSILDTHSAAYTRIMMIMRWSNLQTNEHDLQAIMYPVSVQRPRPHLLNSRTPENAYILLWYNKANWYRIEMRQVAFLWWDQDRSRESQAPIRQLTECLLTKWVSYRGGSTEWCSFV